MSSLGLTTLQAGSALTIGSQISDILNRSFLNTIHEFTVDEQTGTERAGSSVTDTLKLVSEQAWHTGDVYTVIEETTTG
jgi:hypothetical protein